jgi:hypothetical protein
MKNPSVGIRAVLRLNEEEGADLNHQGRVRVARWLNGMVKREVMKERRRCARLCEEQIKSASAQGGHWHPNAWGLSDARRKIINGEQP